MAPIEKDLIIQKDLNKMKKIGLMIIIKLYYEI